MSPVMWRWLVCLGVVVGRVEEKFRNIRAPSHADVCCSAMDVSRSEGGVEASVASNTFVEIDRYAIAFPLFSYGNGGEVTRRGLFLRRGGHFFTQGSHQARRARACLRLMLGRTSRA